MSQLTPFSVNTKIVNVSKDERGVLRADVTPEAQRWFSRLHDEVVRISQLQQKSLIHSFDELPRGGVAAAVAWPVANLAFLVPFTVYSQVKIKRILIPVIVASGNVDVGIYRPDKTKVVSSGSVIAMGSSIAQAIKITPSTLDVGRYYMAVAAYNAVLQGIRYATDGGYNRLFGVFESGSSFPLPATATFNEHLSRALVPSMALDAQGGQISISFVGASANATAASGDLPVTPPATQTNDIMICAVSTLDNVALSFPAGWTIYREGNNTAAMRSTLAWKRCTGAEAAFTITHTAGSNIVANVAVYRGCVATGSPINASSLRHDGVSGTCTADAITPTVPNCLILFSMHSDVAVASSGQAATDPATLTERFDNSLNPGVSLADGYNVAGGSTGNATGSTAAARHTGGLTALTPLQT